MNRAALTNKVQNDRFRLFATLSRHFNSYFEIARDYHNFITDKVEELVFTSPFVDFYKISAQDKCKISVWAVTESSWQKLESHAAYIETFGERPSKLYIPEDFQGSYKSLFQLLGKPDDVLEGVLVSSGRSIWVFSDEGPFCIKYDTSQLVEKKYFTEAQLGEAGIWHSKRVTELLEQEENFFFENGGLSITFHSLYEGEPLKLTYLFRRPNPNFGFSPSDNLIPLHCFLSQRFWEQEKLLPSLGINKAFTEYVPELAQVFADFIAGAISRTALHFESHQQNISLQISSQGINKIIVQDLQDTLFDPISYFGIMKPQNSADFSVVRDKIFNFQWHLHFNSQGELIKHDALLREALNVSSFYRRYISNQGHVSESVAVLSGQQQFLNTDFEMLVLENLKKALPLEAAPIENADVLSNDLFWYIDRCIHQQHQKVADDYYAMAQRQGAEEVGVDALMGFINRFVVVVSANFPVHISKINPASFENIYNLFDNSFFLARYDGKVVMIMVFRYVSI